jgi:hypothetical protein
MKENLLIDKSIIFASRIVKLYQYLLKSKKETVISKQLVRSGTSIGANINEANYGQSRSEYIDNETGFSLLKDCLEIKRILIASINTAKENNK